jgi:hypothetical protein
VVVVELLVAFALVAWKLLGPSPNQPAGARPEGDVAKFAVERLGPKEGASVEIVSMYLSYKEWCLAQGARPVDAALFASMFERMCSLSGFAVSAGRVRGLAA